MNNIKEEILYKVWEEKKLLENLKTSSGESIVVVDVGERDNNLAGPDYKNAKIKIGNFLYVGDIEIDINYNNWKLHGHNINKKFNKTILHICLINKSKLHYVYTQDGRKVLSVNIGSYFDSDLIKSIEKDYLNSKNKNEIKCIKLNHLVEKETKLKHIKNLGIERYKRKSARIYHRLKELRYLQELNLNEPIINYQLNPEFINKLFSKDDFNDQIIWQQLLYEFIFEALGYSQNKEIMKHLAESVDINTLKKMKSENQLESIETLLFNVSGLFANDDNLDSDYLIKLKDDWSKQKNIYDGQLYNSEDWNFFKLRPHNFPTLRIAGGAKILNDIFENELFLKIEKIVDEINNPKIITQKLQSIFVVKAKGYWSHHYILNKPSKDKINYFVGISRANEIVLNVIIPLYMLYYDINAKEKQSKKLLNCLNIFEIKVENKIIEDVANGLDLKEYSKLGIYSQGMIEIYRNLCSRDKCLECEIGKDVFDN